MASLPHKLPVIADQKKSILSMQSYNKKYERKCTEIKWRTKNTYQENNVSIKQIKIRAKCICHRLKTKQNKTLNKATLSIK